MKNLNNFIFAVLAVLPIVASADVAPEKFTVGCKVELIGGPNSSSLNDELLSEVKPAYAQSLVRFDLGDYVLRAMSAAKIPKGKSFEDAIPTLDVSIVKKGAGVSGQVNYAFTPVIAQIGESRSVSSFNFLKLDYKGQSYSRIDYTCTMTRVE